MTRDFENTHREIVEKCQKGNRQAQYDLYHLYCKGMYNVCLRMIKDPMEAEDLLQRSFIDVFSKLHTFRFESAVGAWIKRIVVNNCINHLKKRRLQLTELEEHHTGIPFQSVQQEEDNGFPLSVETVKQAIQELPDGYRIVLTLYLIDGFDHEEISQVLDISVSTSKSQYSRARRKLREILAATYG